MSAVESRIRPSEHAAAIVAAEEDVVRDVVILRSRELRRDADAHVFHPAVADREPLGSGDVFHARPERHLRIPDREPLEDVVVGGHDVEQPERAVAIEDDFAVAGRPNDDGPIWRAFGREQIGSVEGGAQRVHVIMTIALVQPRMHQDDVPGLDLALVDHVPVAGAGSRVGSHQSREVRFLFRPAPAWRIDVQHAAVRGRFRLRARADLRDLRRLPAHAVGIRHREPDLILRIRLEVEDAPGELVRHGVGRAEDPLASHSQQRHPWFPPALTGRPVAHFHRGVPVLIAGDLPLESQTDQRGRLDHESPRRRRVLRAQAGGHQNQERERGHQVAHDAPLQICETILPFHPTPGQAGTVPSGDSPCYRMSPRVWLRH